MTRIDETETEMLECFRKWVIELNFYDDMKDMSLEDLKNMYFNIAIPIQKTLEGMGFKMLNFGFSTPDEFKNDKNLPMLKDNKHAVFCIAYNYNGADDVTAYIPFNYLIADPKMVEPEKLKLQRNIVMSFYNGFMKNYAEHHTKDEFNQRTKEILTKIGLGEEEINSVINRKE